MRSAETQVVPFRTGDGGRVPFGPRALLLLLLYYYYHYYCFSGTASATTAAAAAATFNPSISPSLPQAVLRCFRPR